MYLTPLGKTIIYSLLIVIAIALVVGGAALVVHLVDNGLSDDTESASESSSESASPPPDESSSDTDEDTTDELPPETDSGDTDETDADTEKVTDTNGVTVTIYDTEETMYALYNVNARMSYTTESDIYGMFYQGEAVTVTGVTDNGWYQVDWRGYTAYIRSDLLSAESVTVDVSLEEYEPAVTMYASANVNVRESHSTNSTKLDMIDTGTAVTVTGKTANGWYRIEYNGGIAYIKEEYLSREKPAENATDGQ